MKKPQITIQRLSEYVFDFSNIPLKGMFRVGQIEFTGVRPLQKAKAHASRLSQDYDYVIDNSGYLVDLATR